MAQRIPEPEEVLALAQELKDARERVSILQAQWNAFFSRDAMEPEIQAPDLSRLSLNGRILGLLDANPDHTFTTARVTSILEANPNSVGPILSRMVSENKVQRVGHGEYASIKHGVSQTLRDSIDDFLQEEKESPIVSN